MFDSLKNIDCSIRLRTLIVRDAIVGLIFRFKITWLSVYESRENSIFLSFYRKNVGRDVNVSDEP